MNQSIELSVPDGNAGERVDRFVAYSSELELSRSYIQKLVKNEHIVVDGHPVRSSMKVFPGQVVRITVPEPEKLDLVPQNIPLDILYEDRDLLVLNKQPGIVVHPGPGNPDSTLVNALLYHIGDLSSIGGVERPGIVHRLDRDTSGVMIVAKNDRAHRRLTEQFTQGMVYKYYIALSLGRIHENPLIIEEPIGRHPKYRQKMTIVPDGRYAKTEVTPREILAKHATVYTLCNVRIYTGRTHQIRVHLSSRGLPIVGDPVYSKSYAKFKVPYLMLAAVKISFTHPVSGKNMVFEADLPDHMCRFLEKLREKGAS